MRILLASTPVTPLQGHHTGYNWHFFPRENDLRDLGPGITAVPLSCKVAAHLGQSMLSTEDEGPFRRPVTDINCKKSQHFSNLNARLKGKAAPEAKRSPWLIRCEEKSHSLQWLELLGTLNEALVKTALNVSDHRKTPVLHSIVRCLSVRDPSPHEQPCLSYCKITPPPLFSLMPPHPSYLTAITLAGFAYYTCLIAPKVF